MRQVTQPYGYSRRVANQTRKVVPWINFLILIRNQCPSPISKNSILNSGGLSSMASGRTMRRGRFNERNPPYRGNCDATPCPAGVIRRFMPPEPISCAGVCDRLAEGWAPEQIAGWLKAGNQRGLWALGFEAIYAFIYRVAHKGEDLWRYLTRRHKRCRPRRSRSSRDTIKDRVSIHQRPKNIDARTQAGHWEGDLIICKRTRPGLVLHERKSRVTLAARLAGNRRRDHLGHAGDLRSHKTGAA
jgi:IS30 family transposase